MFNPWLTSTYEVWQNWPQRLYRRQPSEQAIDARRIGLRPNHLVSSDGRFAFARPFFDGLHAAAIGIQEADPPTMSAPQVLERLYSLDTSSPDFLRVLYGLIRHDEDEQYSSSLEGAELARLVDFLDDVRPLSSPLRPVVKQPPQTLSAIPTTDDVFRQCLRKLRAICGCHTTLPSSHVVSGDLAKLGDHPIAYGGFADVWGGTLGGRQVCVKVLRVSLNDDQSLTKVRSPSSCHLRVY